MIFPVMVVVFSLVILALIPATAMTLMLPLWQSVLVEAWTNFMHGRI